MLMFTVVHLTASSTSSKDEIVPVQSVAAGAARTACAMARSAAMRRKEDMAVTMKPDVGVERRWLELLEPDFFLVFSWARFR